MKKKKKIIYGQFFTKDDLWLKEQIKSFISSVKASVAYDPFAGNGDMLEAARKTELFTQMTGLDIDSRLSWQKNDSLVKIPQVDDAIIITNPPYMSNYSAARKKIYGKLEKYFSNSPYDDIYLIALDRRLEAAKYAVVIVPETFINSNYRKKCRLHSITVLEENPFTDTDTPVAAVCFDAEEKSFDQIKVYKNGKYIDTLENIEKMRIFPTGSIDVKFNDINGWLGVRCVDSTDPENMIRFDFKDNINYNWKKRIKVSSRLLTLVDVDINVEKRRKFIDECNKILDSIRKNSDDLILSPFKGNMKNGRRRRRLDFKSCRAIIEKAYNKCL
jgi:hypothetical protein